MGNNPNAARARTAFKSLDVNSDGILDQVEITELLKATYNPPIETVKAAFAKRDADGDKKISLEEFIAAALSIDVKAPAASDAKEGDADAKAPASPAVIAEDDPYRVKLVAEFKKLDESGDGFIELHEAYALAQATYQPPSSLIDSFVGLFDKDKDGKITEDEFVRIMSKLTTKGTIFELIKTAKMFDKLDVSADRLVNKAEAFSFIKNQLREELLDAELKKLAELKEPEEPYDVEKVITLAAKYQKAALPEKEEALLRENFTAAAGDSKTVDPVRGVELAVYFHNPPASKVDKIWTDAAGTSESISFADFVKIVHT